MLRYRGSKPPSLPGVVITHSIAATADGYLTAAGARRFGAALARQFIADHARGSYGSDGLFAGGMTISLPGAPSPVPVSLPGAPGPVPDRPAFPLHTLTTNGTDLAGHPDNGDMIDVFNLDDPAAFGTVGLFYHGSARFSVPSGRYFAVGNFFQVRGNVGSYRMVVLPQFTVSGDKTVQLDARQASTRVQLVTPRPAVSQSVSFTVIRAARGTAVAGLGDTASGSGELWVSPVSRRPTDGTLRSYTGGQLTSPHGASVPYGYTLNFVDPGGIIPLQRFTARPASLATVDERYYQDSTSQGDFLTQGGTGYQISNSLIGGDFLPLSLPGRQIQYLSASPPTFWETEYSQHSAVFPGEVTGGQSSGFRLLRAGEHLTESWNQFPLHPAPNTADDWGTIVLPSATRTGDMLLLDITPFSDSTAGHLGTGFGVGFPGKVSGLSGTYELDQNGAKIAGGNAVSRNGGRDDLFVQAKLSHRPASLRFVVTANRASRRFQLSAASRDVWTWPTRPESHATVPAPWLCGEVIRRNTVLPLRKCAVQPMLTLRYQLDGLRLDGNTRPGRQQLEIVASHLEEAKAPPVSAVSLQVSFDRGKSWRRASLRRLSGPRFQAVFSAPTSGTVSLRVSAHDTAGSALTETILAAYRTAAR